MKSVKELRSTLKLSPTEASSQIGYFMKQNVDWDVYLKSKKINLQRGKVWTLLQKREMIKSVLLGKHIPHCAILMCINKDDISNDKWEIIDGKQRLSSVVDFVNDEFYIELDDKLYLFSELPDDYQRAITYFHFRYYVVYEQYDIPVSDEDRINWFKFINFAGTPQDEKHLEKLSC